MTAEPKRSITARMEAKIERIPFSGCWIWAGAQFDGYGRIVICGTARRVHRVMYELMYGPILPGMCVCHRCDVSLCVNPAHLFLGSVAENNTDMMSKGRHVAWKKSLTHCIRGHEFTPDNTILRKDGCRSCRTCQRMHGTKYDHRRRKPRRDRGVIRATL